MDKDKTMDPRHVKALLFVLMGLLSMPEQRARRFLSRVKRLRIPTQKGEVNSVLIGGHNAGRHVIIPEDLDAWFVNVPMETLVAWDPDASPMPPLEPELYKEEGRSLRGLRRFVIKE
jgi:hypothetical protein